MAMQLNVKKLNMSVLPLPLCVCSIYSSCASMAHVTLRHPTIMNSIFVSIFPATQSNTYFAELISFKFSAFHAIDCRSDPFGTGVFCSFHQFITNCSFWIVVQLIFFKCICVLQCTCCRVVDVQFCDFWSAW